MQAEFWLKKWELGETGFDQRTVNEILESCWPAVEAPAGATVLVPLCGKSLDMRWLAEQGHAIVGVELSAVACQAFFDAIERVPRVSTAGSLRAWIAEPYRILQGDFLTATTADIGAVSFFYDRAAMVAMPPDMQPGYARHLLSLLPSGAAGLVNCLEYPPEDMQGPPFSISETRLRELLGEKCRLRRLLRREIETKGTALEGRGLDTVTETAYRVQVAA